MVVCTSAGYSLLHVPAVHSIADTEAKIDELLLSVKNEQVIRDQHRITAAKLRDVTTQIANIQRRVPKEADAATFMNQLTQLAGAENLAIKEYHPEKPEKKNGYAEMKVTLKGQGSFGSICTFVDQLNKLARLSKVSELSLTSEGSETEYPMTATLVIYFGLRGDDAESAREVNGG